MAYMEQTNGIARSYAQVWLLFPFGLSPKLIYGNRTVSISDPERFGAWGTTREQRAYVRTFVQGKKQ